MREQLKHTPGPWFWYEGYDSIGAYNKDMNGTRSDGARVDYGCSDGLYNEQGDSVVSGMWSNDGEADCVASNKADAALIAAAPDLLAALKAFDMGEAIHNTHPPEVSCAQCAARRAIVKAEGR